MGDAAETEPRPPVDRLGAGTLAGRKCRKFTECFLSCFPPLTPSLRQETFAELCVPGCSERQGLLVTTRSSPYPGARSAGGVKRKAVSLYIVVTVAGTE